MLCSKIQLYNYFLKFLLKPNFDLNSFERFASLSQKTLSTSLLKKFQKSEKYHFQTLRKIVFHLKVASKPISKKLPMTKFGFEQFSTLCLGFPESSFNFVIQKFAQKLKNTIRYRTFFLTSRQLQNDFLKWFI